MTVSIARDGGVAIVEISNPPVNALNAAVLDGLQSAFEEVDADNGVAAIVLAGAGERAFVAGADITEFVGLDAMAAAVLAGRVQSLTNRIASCRKPVIVEIHGFCLGGGLELALACDIRVAAEGALLGVPEIKLGLLPGGGGTQRLPRVVGPGRAALLALTGEPISAQTAYEWGLVDRVVDPAQRREAVLELAQTFTERSADALEILKGLLHATADGSIADGLPLEAAAFGRCIETADGREGVSAFLDKRAPAWPTRTGRSG